MRNGLVATLMAVGVVSGGCALSRSVSGLPEGARLIGGGAKVEIVMPQEGIIYIVDDNDRTLVGTKSVEKGETVDFTMDKDGWDELRELKYGGHVPAEAKSLPPRLLLYFAPVSALGFDTEPAEVEAEE